MKKNTPLFNYDQFIQNTYDMLEYTKLYEHINFSSFYHDNTNNIECNLERKCIKSNVRSINKNMCNVLANRHSKRGFYERLTKEDVCSLLYYSVHSNIKGKRAFPAAGAKYCNALYVNINNVNNMSQGIYYFDYFDESLIYVGKPINPNDMKKYLLGQEFATSASVVIFFVANMKLIKEKYGTRGERYALLDAGHISQNFYLVAQALDISTVSVGGFLDDCISKKLMLDNNHKPVYVQCFG